MPPEQAPTPLAKVHAWPQVPQLLVSVVTSRHVPEQFVSVEPHDTTHAPPEHT